MKKIPTIFERDWNGDRGRVLDKPHPDCAWVFAGEGVATKKMDGTACMIRDAKLYKRRELKPTDNAPEGMEIVGKDPETGKIVGWMPVGGGPEDRWHREAFFYADVWLDGTYELVGPKIQGNPEGAAQHMLASHSLARKYPEAPRTFEGLKDWLARLDIEGLVFHHPDGRMAKIKKRDFGLPRTSSVPSPVRTGEA